MHPSDAALRRTAWMLFVLCGLLAAAVVTMAVALARRGVHQAGQDAIGSDVAALVLVSVFACTGMVITREQLRNAVGWMLLSTGALWGITLAAPLYAEVTVVTQLPSQHAAAVVMPLSTSAWLVAIGLLTIFVVLVFPDGHPLSQGWRWLAWASATLVTFLAFGAAVSPHALDGSPVVGMTNPLAFQGSAKLASVAYVAFLLVPICVIASAVSGVVRYRRSVGDERLQLRWLAAAAVFFAGFLVVTLSVGDVVPGLPDGALRALVNDVLPLCTIPVAIAIAVLKYRLYEIDVVINKSLVFAALASFITVVYVAIVVGVGQLVGRGDRPDLALSVAATAVVAVAFQPVRERVQRFANRLVYGQRATPYEVLADFADRVGGSYDADQLLPMMARTVGEGIRAARVEVWLAGGSAWIREVSWSREATTGTEVGTAETLAAVVGDRVVEVRHQGELLGALAVRKPAGEGLNPTEQQLLDDVAGQAGLVLRNVRLIEDLRSSRERLVSTADGERRRLERNLHDGAQQSLVSVMLMLSSARAQLGPEVRTPLGSALDQAADQLRQAIDELRELARGIHPVILTERGLGPAVRSLAERCPVPVVLDDRLPSRPPPPVEASLYYVVAEALTNVAKYAHATQVTVTLTENATSQGDREIVVQVADDGIGGADATRGSGLRGLADRVAVVDGTLRVDSPVGGGTRLTCTVPLRSTQATSTAQMVAAPMVVSR